MRRLFVLLSAALALVAVVPAGTVAQDATPALPQDELQQVAEDTYAFVSQFYVSLVVVTPEGVIVTDPSSQQGPERAEALKAAIASVTDQPVRYVVYSHHHPDHAI